MLRPDRTWLCVPLFPTILALGGLLLGLPIPKLLLLGCLAAGTTVLCAATIAEKGSRGLPAGWSAEIVALQKTVDRIRNREMKRGGKEICAALRRCTGYLPYLGAAARREIAEYYLPAFRNYFTAYRVFEQCGGDDRTMRRMEASVGQIARNFRRICERGEETATLCVTAENELLRKKLQTKEGTDPWQRKQ